MKIYKTANNGAKVFDSYPTWLHAIVKQLKLVEGMPYDVTVHKEKYLGKNSYHFECFDKQVKLIVQQLGETHARLFISRRKRITGQVARIPPYELLGSEDGFIFELGSDTSMNLLEVVMHFHLVTNTGYPLKPERRIIVSNREQCWAHPGHPKIFAGKIAQFDIRQDMACYRVEALTAKGPGYVTIQIPLKLVKGSHARVGKWLIYSPFETFASVTAEAEMGRYFTIYELMEEDSVSQAA